MDKTIEQIMQDIKSDFPEKKVLGMLDDKMSDYATGYMDEEDGFNDYLEWYIEWGNGEAESDVVLDIIVSWEQDYNKRMMLDESFRDEVKEQIRKEYPSLENSY